MSFTVNDCTVTTNSITIIFSDPVDKASAQKLKHYTVFDPGSADFSVPQTLQDLKDSGGKFSVQVSMSSTDPDSVLINFTSTSQVKNEFQPGDWVNIVVKGVTAADKTPLEDGIATIARSVPGKGKTARLTRDVEDAISYPILTEEVGYRSSPVGLPSPHPPHSACVRP